MSFSRDSSTSRAASKLFPGTLKPEARSTVNLERADDDEEHDDVFGDQGKGAINYRSVGWVGTAVILLKSQLGTGILSIPSTFRVLGIIPGLICMLVIAAMTTWTGLVSGRFKLRHPEVYSINDAGTLMFGAAGGEIAGALTWLYQALSVGSGLLAFSTAFNAVTVHGTCTTVFTLVCTLLTILFASFRTLENVRWIGWVGLVSIVSAILTITIAVGVNSRPAAAPQEGPLNLEIVLFGTPSFAEAMNAVGNLVFAFMGASLYLPIASEMADPRQFTEAVILCQSLLTSIYVAIGVVVYYFAGQYVTSPALGTAGPLIKRIAYGLAMPSLLASCVIWGHLAAKYIFVRSLRGTRHLNHSTATHWIVWLGSVIGTMVFAFIVASAIPVFGGLVGLVGSLFGTLFSLQAQAWMWGFDHWTKIRSGDWLRSRAMWLTVPFNAFVFIAGMYIMGAGTYGAAIQIRDDYAANGGVPFSCADTSGSV
ncbi:hypothetical protein JCM6882_002328 [Rhodosporidiobolus microsporus]